MKILLSSYAFSPSVGGIEAVSAMLADEFVTAGHELRVVTLTPSHEENKLRYEVVRQPGSMELIELIDWSAVCTQAGHSYSKRNHGSSRTTPGFQEMFEGL
jgi:hypothetical protein